MRTNDKRRRGKALFWLPTAVVLVASIAVAAGISLMPSATAASQSGTVTIGGTVDASIAFSAVCADVTNPFAGSVTFGANFAPGSAAQVTPTCPLTFQSNDDSELSIEDSAAADANPFFCTGTCGTDQENFDNVAAGPSALPASDGFGGILNVAAAGTNACDAGCATGAGAGWTAAAGGSGDTGDGQFYPVPELGSADKICGSSGSTGAGSVTCTIRFGGVPGLAGNQLTGSYAGTANVTVATIP
jgi:hypothetical protein